MKRKILVADDQANVRRILEFNLRRKGFEVVSAGDGIQTLAKLEQEKPDLLILDIMMPGVDGYQVLERLAGNGGAPCPILVISAKGTQGDIVRALKLGAKDYIVKPFNLEMVLQKVFRLVEGAGGEAKEATGADAAAPAGTSLLVRVSPLPDGALERIEHAAEAATKAGVRNLVVDLTPLGDADTLFFARLVKVCRDHRLAAHLCLPQEKHRTMLSQAGLAKHFTVHEELAAAAEAAGAAEGGVS